MTVKKCKRNVKIKNNCESLAYYLGKYLIYIQKSHIMLKSNVQMMKGSLLTQRVNRVYE